VKRLAIAPALLALVSPLLAQYDRFGAPACDGPNRELADRQYFVLCHSSELKVPVWVGYELSPDRIIRGASRPSRFSRDAALSTRGAQDSDYRGSGYTRGHMAPAADFAFSDDAIRATFVLSNVVPQVRKVNCGLWAVLETAVRSLAMQFDTVTVYTGPIFDSQPETIGVGRVAVPSHTYKAILAAQGSRKVMYAAIVQNSAQGTRPLRSYFTTIDEVERLTGFDFFAALPDLEEREFESAVQVIPHSARRTSSRFAVYEPE
jgi:endonuclease G